MCISILHDPLMYMLHRDRERIEPVRCQKTEKPLRRIPPEGLCLYASRTVSRVLYLAVIYLGGLLPDRSSHLLRTAGPATCPPTVLLRIEFTASDSLQPMGELLPRLSTLTSSAQGRPLARDEAVYLCCTFPEVAFGGRYPLSLPCGARTFLMTVLSNPPRDRLSCLPNHFTGTAPPCQ